MDIQKIYPTPCQAINWDLGPALQIPMTLTNTTGGVIEFAIREKGALLAHFTLVPNQQIELKLPLDPNLGVQREFHIETIGHTEDYGMTSSTVRVDLNRLPKITLGCREEWISPGQSFWPPVSDFMVVKVYCQD